MRQSFLFLPRFFSVPSGFAGLWCALCVLSLGGCDAPVEHFPPNRVHALVISTDRNVSTQLASEDTTAAVEAWFGTPERPIWPPMQMPKQMSAQMPEQMFSDEAKALVDPDHLVRAAGRVYSDQDNRHFGLFNEHCVTCHGVSGGGDGPASQLQNPYPRDFRPGVFKWKSTSLGAKPTRDDLRRILVAGAPGSAMPSFAQLSEEDLEALVDYVIFLSVRGEFERRMIGGAVDELGYEESRPESELSLLSLTKGDTETDAVDYAAETLDWIVESWVGADDKVIEVPEETAEDSESIRRGRDLFHGRIANCAGCHGKDGNPVEIALDYDDWTKEFTSRLSITPTDREAVRPFRKAGAPRPRQIVPRRLSLGVHRGGGDPETLYRRIVTGIAGTPMPAVAIVDEPSGLGLTSSQVWDLVHYVRSLGGDNSAGSEQAGSEQAGSEQAGSSDAGGDR